MCVCVFIATGTKSGQISMPNSGCQTQETYLIYSLAAVNVHLDAEILPYGDHGLGRLFSFGKCDAKVKQAVSTAQ